MKTEEEVKKKLIRAKKDIENSTNEWSKINLRKEETVLEWFLE